MEENKTITRTNLHTAENTEISSERRETSQQDFGTVGNTESTEFKTSARKVSRTVDFPQLNDRFKRAFSSKYTKQKAVKVGAVYEIGLGDNRLRILQYFSFALAIFTGMFAFTAYLDNLKSKNYLLGVATLLFVTGLLLLIMNSKISYMTRKAIESGDYDLVSNKSYRMEFYHREHGCSDSQPWETSIKYTDGDPHYAEFARIEDIGNGVLKSRRFTYGKKSYVEGYDLLKSARTGCDNEYLLRTGIENANSTEETPFEGNNAVFVKDGVQYDLAENDGKLEIKSGGSPCCMSAELYDEIVRFYEERKNNPVRTKTVSLNASAKRCVFELNFRPKFVKYQETKNLGERISNVFRGVAEKLKSEEIAIRLSQVEVDEVMIPKMNSQSV